MIAGSPQIDLAFALDPSALFERLTGFPPDDWQRKVLAGSHRQIILNCHRQAGKSTIAAVKATHKALYSPGSLSIIVSPSERQSKELLRKCRHMLFQFDPEVELTEDNKLSCELSNRARIVALPSSEATIRGFSAVDLLIEDEASRTSDELYTSVRPMLAVSGGGLIQMSTPFGRRGHFYDTWIGGSRKWLKIEVPVTECTRISAEFLEEERRSMPEWVFKQEYLCHFAENENAVFRHEDVIRAFTDEVTPLFFNN